MYLFYILYIAGGDLPAVTGLEAFPKDAIQKHHRSALEGPSPLATLLPYQIGSHAMYLFVSRGEGSPLEAMEIHVAPDTPPDFGGREIVTLTPSLPAPLPVDSTEVAKCTRTLGGVKWFLTGGGELIFEDGEETTDPEELINNDMYFLWLEGPYHTGLGYLEGPLVYSKTNNQARFDLVGSWRFASMSEDVLSAPVPVAHLCTLSFDSSIRKFSGHLNHGIQFQKINGELKEKPVSRSGYAEQIYSKYLYPITHLSLARSSDEIPEGFVCILKTEYEQSSSLCSAEYLYLCISRDPKHGPPLVDVVVLFGGIDELPSGTFI